MLNPNYLNVWIEPSQSFPVVLPRTERHIIY